MSGLGASITNSWRPLRRMMLSCGPSRDAIVRSADALASVIAAAGLIVIVAASTSAPDEPGASGTSDSAKAMGSPPLVAPGREWLVAAYGGVPYTYPSDVRITKTGTHDFTAKDVEWEGQPFENPIYYGVRIVRWFSGGRTGSMLDFTHSKALSRKTQETRFEGTLDGKPAPERALIGDVFRRLEASHGHNMLTLNGLMRLPSFSMRVSPYVGLGAGVSLPHSEVHVVGETARTYEYQMAGPVGQALIGLELRLPRMSYFIEYKFSLADYRMPLTNRDGNLLPIDLWAQFQQWWRGEEPPGGWAETRLTSHQVIGGLGVRLVAGP